MEDIPVCMPLDQEESDLAQSIEQLTSRPPSLLTPETRAEIEAMARATLIKIKLTVSLKPVS